MDTSRENMSLYFVILKRMLKANKHLYVSRTAGDNIFRLNTPYASSYLIRTQAGCVVVDTDLPGCSNFIIKNLCDLGFSPQDLKYIFLTHGHLDHAGSAGELRELTNAKIVVGRLCSNLEDEIGHVPFISGSFGRVRRFFLKSIINLLPRPAFQADIVVRNEESLNSLGVDGYVLETPGHTKGSISIVLEQKVVFVGDVFRKLHTQVLPNNFADDPEMNYISAQKLKRLRGFLFLPGHKGSFFDKEIYCHADGCHTSL